MLNGSIGTKEIIDKIGKIPQVLIVDLSQYSINVDLYYSHYVIFFINFVNID